MTIEERLENAEKEIEKLKQTWVGGSTKEIRANKIVIEDENSKRRAGRVQRWAGFGVV
jgi:hypothetical protein